VLNPSLTVRRKKTDKVVDPGSVPMLGQRLTIRIISTDYLREHRLYRHRYEVMSKKSSYRATSISRSPPIRGSQPTTPIRDDEPRLGQSADREAHP